MYHVLRKAVIMMTRNMVIEDDQVCGVEEIDKTDEADDIATVCMTLCLTFVRRVLRRVISMGGGVATRLSYYIEKALYKNFMHKTWVMYCS